MLALILLPGCIGVSFVAGTRQCLISENIGDEIGDANNRPGIVTDSTVAYLWGKPKRKEIINGREVWMYRSEDFSWRGMEVWVIIPIPLLLPVGLKKVTLEFTEGILTKYTIDNGRERFFGLFLDNADDRLWRFNHEVGYCSGYGCY